MKALALIVAVVALACGGASHGPAPLPPQGDPIRLALPALDGGELEVARYRGQVVVLHVFTTGSLAAAADVDQLEAAATAKRAIVIGIALDLDGRALVAPWRTGSGVTYLVALADARVRDGTSALGAVAAVPMTIVLDRRGRPVARIERQLAAGELDTIIAGAAAGGP